MKESEIRPQEIFNKYLELAEKDVETYFSNCKYHERKCPACGEEGKFEFKKKGFDYYMCHSCRTLYVNPLPEEDAFIRYYSESPSTKFWATDFYKHTENARREKIYAPRAGMLSEIISKYNKEIKNIIDIGGGYGTFAEELNKDDAYDVYVIEPNKDLGEVLTDKKLNLIPKFLEDVSKADLPDGAKCFTSFELVEHLTNPRKFFETLFGAMDDGDLLVFTTLSGMGLDILVLWNKSKAVHPPHHINFFNPSSIKGFLASIGFEVLEVKTPGKLDIDILCNNKKDIHDRFWGYFIETADEELKNSMQEFIQNNNLSSHMLIVAQKGVNK